MANYVFAFHGGNEPKSPEEGEAIMAKWGVWMQGLGEAIVNPGAPVGQSSTVSSKGVAKDDGGSNPLSGFTIVQADDMDGALKMAGGCPILENNGTVEVAEMLAM